jgi:hypothetical protein
VLVAKARGSVGLLVAGTLLILLAVPRELYSYRWLEAGYLAAAEEEEEEEDNLRFVV